MSKSLRVIFLLAVVVALAGALKIVVDKKLSPTIDKNNDGKPDEWFSYSLSGDLLSLEKDRNYDGTVDHKEKYRDGKIARMAVDMNNDGVFEVTSAFDDEGRMISMERDLDNDGKPDRRIRFDPETQRQIGEEPAGKAEE